MTSPMIQTEGLVKTFGQVRALDGLDLRVEKGVVYGFLGPNGAGKTTTLRILAGLARPNQGWASINSQKVLLHNRDQLKEIGVLPEEPAFYGWMTASEYLRSFVAPLYGVQGEKAHIRTAQILEKVGLAHAAERRIQGFSRGMRQRLGLAQALIHQPPVLLLDEPVSALDPSGRKEILDLIDGLRGETTILLSTHILADVERICDVVGIINQGKMVVEDRRERLLERYALPLIEIEVACDLSIWIEKALQMPFVENFELHDNKLRLQVTQIERAQRELLNSLAEEDVLVNRFEIVRPSLEDIFLRLTQNQDHDEMEA